MAAGKNNKCYELALNYNCNARCSFCSQASFDKKLNSGFARVAGNIYMAYKAGYRRLGLTGGEPLISPDILRAIALGRSVGFEFIRIQTNGIKLSDPAFCRKLVRAGLTFCKFSLASDRAEEHDRLMGVPGAYNKALKGVKNMRRLKIRLCINMLVTRLNYRRLPDMIRSFLELGVTNFVIVYPLYIGAMKENYGELGISLGDCERYFASSAAVMTKAGLGDELLFLNVPPCFLAGRESASIGLEAFNTVVTDPLGAMTNLDDVANLAKVRVRACRGCGLRDRCAGVDVNYVRIFGAGGFHPVEGRHPPRSLENKRARLFFSDNELCLVEILKKENMLPPRRVLELAKNIVLCRDCVDGNSVMNAAHSLGRKGVVSGIFRRGSYYWRLSEIALKLGTRPS